MMRPIKFRAWGTDDAGLIPERLKKLRRTDFGVIEFNQARAEKEDLEAWAQRPEPEQKMTMSILDVPREWFIKSLTAIVP